MNAYNITNKTPNNTDMSNIIAITLFVYVGIMSALCIGGCYYSIMRGLKETVTPQ